MNALGVNTSVNNLVIPFCTFSIINIQNNSNDYLTTSQRYEEHK